MSVESNGTIVNIAGDSARVQYWKGLHPDKEFILIDRDKLGDMDYLEQLASASWEVIQRRRGELNEPAT